MITDTFRNMFSIPDLRKRILYTFLILGIYRIGTWIPTPGIDLKVLSDFFKSQGGGAMGFLNLFSGGAMERAGLFALGIMPYITASIIIQLLGVVSPTIEKLIKEGGAEGRKKITQYTRYGTILIGIVQGLGISFWLTSMKGPAGASIVRNPNMWFHIQTVIVLTSGTALLMWLGEQITARGIGNGISLLIFSGIVVGLVPASIYTFQQMQRGDLSPFVIILLVLFMILVIGIIVYFERAQRKIPVQYAKRIVGRRMVGGASVYFPLKLNPSGVIPPIFASSILIIPQWVTGFFANKGFAWAKAFDTYFHYGTLTYLSLYIVMIAFFVYFYTSVIFNPDDLADNLKKAGGFIPGIRPGKKTSEYLYRVLNRLLFVGAIYLAVIAVLPIMLISGFPLQNLAFIGTTLANILDKIGMAWLTTGFNVQFYFGGTSLLIVVGVAMDTVQQVESQLVMRHYEGFMRHGRIRGRRS